MLKINLCFLVFPRVLPRDNQNWGLSAKWVFLPAVSRLCGLGYVIVPPPTLWRQPSVHYFGMLNAFLHFQIAFLFKKQHEKLFKFQKWPQGDSHMPSWTVTIEKQTSVFICKCSFDSRRHFRHRNETFIKHPPSRWSDVFSVEREPNGTHRERPWPGSAAQQVVSGLGGAS